MSGHRLQEDGQLRGRMWAWTCVCAQESTQEDTACSKCARTNDDPVLVSAKMVSAAPHCVSLMGDAREPAETGFMALARACALSWRVNSFRGARARRAELRCVSKYTLATHLDASMVALSALPFISHELNLTTDQSLWKAWTPQLPALPAPPGHVCSWLQLNFTRSADRSSWDGADGPVHACLGPRTDIFSSYVMRNRRWDECLQHVLNWRSREDGPEAQAPGKSIWLEVGANIGMCTLEMLWRTDAHVVALEPSPANLFYLTSTLAAAAKLRPSVADRVLVIPLAAGDAASTSVLYAANSNAGNSVVGQRIADHGKQAMDVSYEIQVRTVDSLVTALHGASFPGVKIDVQGFECRAVRGMRRLLRTGAVRSLTAEFANNWLGPQGCSSDELLRLLASVGFGANSASPPGCIYSRYGCDLTLHWRAPSTCVWSRPFHGASSWDCKRKTDWASLTSEAREKAHPILNSSTPRW